MKISAPTAFFGSVGTMFGLGLLRVPEQYRNKLPEFVDIGSVSSNFFASLGLMMLATELTARQESPRTEKLVKGIGLNAVNLVMNLAVENETVNSLLLPDELKQVHFGYGIGGETRDVIAGVIGGLIGYITAVRSSKPSGSKSKQRITD